MATFRTYAEVLRPDDVMVKMHEAGIVERPPGLVLEDVVQRSGGVYEVVLPLGPGLQKEIREVAELASDEQLLAIAELGEVPTSLEHFRHLDPQTRIVMGCVLDVTPEESEQLGWKAEFPPDPNTTLLVGDYHLPGGSHQPGQA